MQKRRIAAALLCAALLSGCGAVPAAQDALVPTAAPTLSPPPAPAPTPVPTPHPTGLRGLLADMSPREKVWQVLMLCSWDDACIADAAEHGVGGVCLYAVAFSGKSADEVRAMTADLQARSPLPLILSVDEEGGTVNRVSINRQLRAFPFVAPRILYERGGWDLLERETVEKAQLLLSLGLNVNLAPVADLPLNRSNYIYLRSFGTDPAETSEFVRRSVAVMGREGLGCCLKHFPGYGGSADTHLGQGLDTRDYEAFLTRDFLPFRAGIEAGADAVLVSHNIVQCMDSERPASLSPEVHRILREELGFEGVILCDDLSMGAIGVYTGGEDAAVAALLAGNDFLCCADAEAAAAALLEALADGRLSEAQLDASVLRILQWKAKLGLL